MLKQVMVSLFIVSSLFSNIVLAKAHYTDATNEQIQMSEEQNSARDVSVQIDQYYSPMVGGDLMITTMRGYQALDNFIPTSAGDRSGPLILGRLAKLVVIEGTVVGLQMVTQHEVFGHGFRAREFHVPTHYHITPWSGATYLNAFKYNQLSLSEQAALETGGLEATTLLAKQLRNRWIKSDTIDSREAQLYFESNLDQTLYILNTRLYKDGRVAGNGHDVVAYINTVNEWYQRPVLTACRLRKQVLLDFLDPYLFYSLYSMGNYIIDGEQSFEYPMINIGEYRYLPAARMVLAPYGPEYQLNNFIKGPEHTIQAAIRYGNTGGRISSGLTLETTRLISSDLLTIDGRADVWNQPKLFRANAGLSRAAFGGALSLIARYKIASCVEIMGQAGYKTSGYIPGEVLKHSPILRIGFSAFL